MPKWYITVPKKLDDNLRSFYEGRPPMGRNEAIIFLIKEGLQKRGYDL